MATFSLIPLVTICLSLTRGYKDSNTNTVGACSDDLGCSLNGGCYNGVCACTAPWTGSDCSVLEILPSDEKGGAIYGVSPNVSSWGGNIVVGKDGKFHLFVSEFAGKDCGMVSWLTNSQITHATSDTIDGTYTKADVAVGSFAHNPQVIVFGNELFLFHIGSGNGSAHVNCTGPAFDGNHEQPSTVWAQRRNANLFPDALTNGRTQQTTIHTAPGPDGPWSSVESVECDNPAPLVLRNGTVLLMCSRSPTGQHAWRLYRADTPRGPWSHVTEVYPRSNRTGPQSEDPFLWEDANGFLHVLSHTFPPEGPNGEDQPSTVMSIHGFSRDALEWHWSADQPYNSTIVFKDGHTVQHATAERPKLVIGSDGVPTHLINGLTTYLWPCNACPGCPTSPGKPYPGCPHEHMRVCNKCKMLPGKDSTYTIMRALRT
eukprot:m.80694 g.80694  ORF g.80694 m.80694 type:complete len:429 (-) comp25339_c0_seq3:104-1390(-)